MCSKHGWVLLWLFFMQRQWIVWLHLEPWQPRFVWQEPGIPYAYRYWKSTQSYIVYEFWSFYLTTLFYLFQWCPEGRVSLWYVMYRVCMALLFVGCVAGHAITGGNGVKWLTYMTDLGVMFLTLHYVIDATLSVCRWTWEHYNPNDTCKESCSSIWFISLDAPLVHIHNWTFSRSSRTKT